jgi:hypothetical protein
METMMERALPGVISPLRVFPTTNAEQMYALDEAWNARDWDTFDAYHDPDHVVVYWPQRQSMPTRGGPDHRAEAERFCRAFPDNKVKHQPRLPPHSRPVSRGPAFSLAREVLRRLLLDDCACFLTRFKQCLARGRPMLRGSRSLGAPQLVTRVPS